MLAAPHASAGARQEPAPAAPPRRLPAEPGQTIDGRLRVVRLLDVGGMGCVFLAHHHRLNQPVALKLMLPELTSNPGAVACFMREARAASRLQSEHVCRVLDLGSLPDGSPYLVMELLDGETAERRLHREGPYPPAVAVSLVRQAVAGVAEAHRLGVIHRDLKPANLFLARKPSGLEVVKVLDFGIASSMHPDIEAGLEATRASSLQGSLQYMAPEQLAPDAEVGPEVDVWALGCALYELIAGRPPFSGVGSSVAAVMEAIRSAPHLPLWATQPTVSRALSALVDRCLAKAPAERPTLLELEGALAGLREPATATPSGSPVPLLLGARTPAPEPSADAREPRHSEPRARGGLWLAVAGAVLASAGLAGLLAAEPWSAAEAPAPSPDSSSAPAREPLSATAHASPPAPREQEHPRALAPGPEASPLLEPAPGAALARGASTDVARRPSDAPARPSPAPAHPRPRPAGADGRLEQRR